MDFEADIIQCLDVLRRGGTIVYPTDTIWGIGCDATDPDAVQKVFELKRRPPVKSLIVLIADPRDVNRYISHPQPQVAEWLEQTEKPTTVIYDGAIGLADNLIAEDGSVALRIVREDFCRHLIKRFRKPLVSTSANMSGMPPPENFSHIDPEILKGAGYVVQYRRDDLRPAAPSSLVRFNASGKPTVLRP